MPWIDRMPCMLFAPNNEESQLIRKLVCSLFVTSLTAGLVTADEFSAVLTKVDGDKVTFQKYKDVVRQTGKDGDPVTLPVAKDAKILEDQPPLRGSVRTTQSESV